MQGYWIFYMVAWGSKREFFKNCYALLSPELRNCNEWHLSWDNPRSVTEEGRSRRSQIFGPTLTVPMGTLVYSSTPCPRLHGACIILLLPHLHNLAFSFCLSQCWYWANILHLTTKCLLPENSRKYQFASWSISLAPITS